MPLPLTTLLQLADSAFPTGGFAYSNGLEAAARSGRFATAAALEEYVDVYLRQSQAYDLAFVAAGHAREGAAFAELCREWDAGLWNVGMRRASLRQGRALADVAAETFPAPALARLRAEASRHGLHYAPALGRVFALLGATREQAFAVYLHGLARDQVAAAVRLGLLGPRTAQALQARVLAAAEARDGGVPDPRDAWRTAPCVEAAQGGHDFLYSRLFQN